MNVLSAFTVSVQGHVLQPTATAENEHVRVTCYGELQSYGRISDTLPAVESIAEASVHGALRYDQLNGRFILILEHKSDSEWLLITDPLSSLHAYVVYRGSNAVAFGTHLTTLGQSASARQLDWQAITTFFAFGFFLNDRTYFDDIRILEPGSVYRFSADGKLLKHERYHQWHHTVEDSRSYDETVDQYAQLLEQAVRRCSDGRIILPLSGGLDSRSLAAVLPSGPETQAYSYGYTPHSIETRIARQIAEARGFRFTPHVIPPYLFDRLEEIVVALHGSQDVTQARQASISHWLGEQADAVLTGLWGDVWCDQMGLADGLPDGMTLTSYTLKKIQKRGSDWLLQNLCAPQLQLSMADVSTFLTEQIETGLSAFEHIEDLDFRLKAYKTSQWAFRWSNASLRAFELGATPRVPYYDSDLVEFFCTVPTAFVRDRRLQIDYLKRYAPDLARIQWQQAEANLYLANYGHWLGLPRRAVNKALRLIRHERPIQRNWEVQFLAPAEQAGLQHWLMRSGLKLHEFVAPQAIKELLDRFFAAPDGADGYTVAMLLTFSVWLETTC